MLARLTEETKTQVVTEALRERLKTACRGRSALNLLDELDEIATPTAPPFRSATTEMRTGFSATTHTDFCADDHQQLYRKQGYR